MAKKLDLVYNIDLNITFGTYRLCLVINLKDGAYMWEPTKLQWTVLAMIGPLNPQTGKKYHPSTLEKVWNGKRRNVFLSQWLASEMKNHAKTKEGTRDTKGKGIRRKDFQSDKSEITELSKLTKAIRGKANSD
ncbi:hypothetical protein KAR91_30100 [Candidatus Pacearchaeota archaeon]|nr:hypothetical protein [Candidatus Pacearchaeota archaeon]